MDDPRRLDKLILRGIRLNKGNGRGGLPDHWLEMFRFVATRIHYQQMIVSDTKLPSITFHEITVLLNLVIDLMGHDF